MSEDKNITAAIADAVSHAAEDENFVLPLAYFQAKSSVSDEINAAYEEELGRYKQAPVPPCDRKNAHKLLRRFARKSFHEFWTSPVLDYLPAVSEGTMKLCERVYPHDEAVRYAKELIAPLSVAELARDFLYGVAHNAPEYRTALACYYYIKNLPEHAFEKKWVGQAPDKNGVLTDRYNETACAVCGYCHSVSEEPKMQFFHINLDMAKFYFDARMGRSSLNTAILYLEEYKTLPRPAHTASDYEHFKKIIEVIENTPQNMTSGKLRRELKQSRLLSMTLDGIEVFINTLGYLDILHPDDSHGMIYTHTPQGDMLYPLSDRGYAEHPVNRWTRKCGVDYASISLLFDGIYD